jgi:hypothetical protein
MPYGLRPPPAGIGNRHMQAEHRVSPRARAKGKTSLPTANRPTTDRRLPRSRRSGPNTATPLLRLKCEREPVNQFDTVPDLAIPQACTTAKGQHKRNQMAVIQGNGSRT